MAAAALLGTWKETTDAAILVAVSGLEPAIAESCWCQLRLLEDTPVWEIGGVRGGGDVQEERTFCGSCQRGRIDVSAVLRGGGAGIYRKGSGLRIARRSEAAASLRSP